MRLFALPNNMVAENMQDSSRKHISLKAPLIPRTAQETFGDGAGVQLEGQNTEFIGQRNDKLDIHIDSVSARLDCKQPSEPPFALEATIVTCTDR